METRSMSGVPPEPYGSRDATGDLSAGKVAATPPRVPDYELLRPIGRGAYGDVWLARGLTGVYRAVKIVWRARFTEAEPFHREFRGVAESMSHSLEPGQLGLLHIGQNEADGFFYYVMELADDATSGSVIEPQRYVPLTLKELKARRGRLPARECRELALRLTGALAALHARGLVHRDIKPSNIILVNGIAKLADIGLVASTSDARTFVGTQGYLPPEGPGAPAADVFALGKVLYELATGFDHDEYPRLPSEFSDAKDRAALFDLNEVLLRACEPEQSRRYKDAGAMLADLRALQTGHSPRTRRAWRARTGSILVGAAVMVGAVAFWMNHRHAPSESAGQAPLAGEHIATPEKSNISEARQLEARARALFDAFETSRDDYKLAEDLLEQAKTKDPNNAEVWASLSELNQLYVTRGWDRSDARRQAALTAGQRALRLDPLSFEARFARAVLLETTGRDGEEREKQLRVLRAERPQDKRVLRALAATVGYQGRVEEVIQLTNEAAALPGGDPLALYDQSRHLWIAGRALEAERVLQASMKQQLSSSSLLLDAWYKVLLHGDLEGAHAVLAQISPAALLEDRGVYFSYYVALLRRDTNEALERLRVAPRDWIDDFFYRGPKGLLAGDALHAAGRASGAALEWQAALKLVEERLTAKANNPSALALRVGLLARLGQHDEAVKQSVVLMQLAGIDLAADRPAPTYLSRPLTQAFIFLGQHADALRQMRAVARQPKHILVDFTASTLRLDPLFDPLRGDPEFQRLLDEVDRKERDAALKASRMAGGETTGNTEARQLAVQAQRLFESLGNGRADHTLAEELIAKAKMLDPMDAEVAAVEAQLHAKVYQRGWDKSDQRREAARAAAQRAMRLDPQSFEARLAQAGLLDYFDLEGAEKERQLRLLRQERPQDQRVLRMLAATLAWRGRLEEALPLMDESAALPGGDPLALYDKSRHLAHVGRYAEAERALDASLAQQPFSSAVLLAVWHKMLLHGDLEGAQEMLKRVPGTELQEDRGAYFAYFLAFLRRDPDTALARLRAVPREWIDDNFYRGPKQRLIGDILAVAGRDAAAAVEWRAALKLVDARIAVKSSPFLVSVRVALLACLGEREKATQELVILRQMLGINEAGEQPAPPWITRSFTQACILLGHDEAAINQIRAVLKQPQHVSWDYSAATLRLDPLFDPLRDKPEFKRLIAEADAMH